MRRRNYELKIKFEESGEIVTIRPPFRISFSCFKATDGAGFNRTTLKLYNLSPVVRERLLRGPADSNFIHVTLSVGYNNKLDVLVSANVMRGLIERSDADIVSTLECLDVGFFGNDSEPPYVSKVVQSKKEAYAELKRRGLDVGKITEQPDIVRPKLIHGDLTDSLESLLSAGDEWFIDDGKLHVLKANGEVIDDFVPVISAESGLVGVPTRDMNMLELTTIINPSVKIGTMAEVKSSLNPRMNGMGKVVSVETTGDTDGDQWEQNVKLVMVGDVFNGL